MKFLVQWLISTNEMIIMISFVRNFDAYSYVALLFFHFLIEFLTQRIQRSYKYLYNIAFPLLPVGNVYNGTCNMTVAS